LLWARVSQRWSSISLWPRARTTSALWRQLCTQWASHLSNVCALNMNMGGVAHRVAGFAQRPVLLAPVKE